MGERYNNIEHIVNIEPRILYIKEQLESLLKIVDLEKDGNKVDVNGFRLKNPSDWRNTMPANILATMGTFSSKCNCECEFCYERGLTKIKGKLNIFPKKGMLTLKEAKTRAELYDRDTGTGMFVPTVDSMEPTLNPNWLDILKIAREKTPNELLDISNTNGTNLTEDVIKELADLKPIRVNISLLSATPAIRKKVMKDLNPEIAINSIPLLRKYGISYSVSIVSWPTIPLEDIEKTIKYVDKYDPVEVQIQLPGFTKYGFDESPFDTEDNWSQVINMIEILRSEVKTPIYASPYAYEVNGSAIPEIVGVIKNSPAESAGFKLGDRILEVDGVKVLTRSYCNDILRKPTDNQEKVIKVLRDGEVLKLYLDCSELSIDKNCYPYKPSGYEDNPHLHYGIFMPESFRLNYFSKIDKLAKKHNANSVLLTVSRLMYPYIKDIIPVFKENGYFKDLKIHMKIPKNKFWGGNVCLADLLTVQDFIDCIEEFIESNSKPDLVIIPSSGFSEWGRDITGANFLDIERKVNVDVELIKCAIIWR